MGRQGILLFSFLVITCLSTLNDADAQKSVTIQMLDTGKLPPGAAYEGTITEGGQWTDSLGEHIVITTETGSHRSRKFKHENDGEDAELFAYHFLLRNDSAFRTWRIYDYVTDCPVDITATFLKSSFSITDLDNDAVAEVWVMYKTACSGDVSPCTMKIIMYEGQAKYAMRGSNKVEIGDGDFEGGEYTFDSAFINDPGPFREFAKKLWNKHLMQTYGTD